MIDPESKISLKYSQTMDEINNMLKDAKSLSKEIDKN